MYLLSLSPDIPLPSVLTSKFLSSCHPERREGSVNTKCQPLNPLTFQSCSLPICPNSIPQKVRITKKSPLSASQKETFFYFVSRFLGKEERRNEFFAIFVSVSGEARQRPHPEQDIRKAEKRFTHIVPTPKIAKISAV